MAEAARAGAPRALLAAAAALALACAPAPAPPGAAAGPRIAVLAPAAAETLAALGVEDAVVAVGGFVTWPPVFAARPRLDAFAVAHAERLLALGVDLVVTTASVAGRAERARLAGLGIELVELDTESYAAALESMRSLGRRVGRGAEAERLAAAVEARVAAVAARAAALPRRRVLLVVGREPLFVAGPGSHLDHLLAAAGGENLAADLGAPYAQAALEAMVARLPEVIVDSSENRVGAAARAALARDWGRFPTLPAVAAGRVWAVDPSRLSIPGPRMGETAELLARLVHPERLGAPAPAELGPLDRAEER